MINLSKPMHYKDGLLVVWNERGPISINDVEYPDMWKEAQAYLLAHPEALIPEPVPPEPTPEELAARKVAEEIWELYSKPGMARMSGPVISATDTPYAVASRNIAGQVSTSAPIPSATAGSIGIMTAIDVASGAALTMPSGSGTYQWVVQTYGATVNSVKTGQTAAAASPGGTASANCTVLVWRIA